MYNYIYIYVYICIPLYTWILERTQISIRVHDVYPRADSCEGRQKFPGKGRTSPGKRRTYPARLNMTEKRKHEVVSFFLKWSFPF